MKPIATTVVLNTRWCYCFTPETFPSKRKALEHARWMVANGYAWAYRIIKRKE